MQEEKAELKAANHRLMREKALLQSNVQDQKNSSDDREDNTHSQVKIMSSTAQLLYYTVINNCKFVLSSNYIAASSYSALLLMYW